MELVVTISCHNKKKISTTICVKCAVLNEDTCLVTLMSNLHVVTQINYFLKFKKHFKHNDYVCKLAKN
jgi:hypothetical protein